jgi:hypothetical protein
VTISLEEIASADPVALGSVHEHMVERAVGAFKAPSRGR